MAYFRGLTERGIKDVDGFGLSPSNMVMMSDESSKE